MSAAKSSLVLLAFVSVCCGSDSATEGVAKSISDLSRLSGVEYVRRAEELAASIAGIKSQIPPISDSTDIRLNVCSMGIRSRVDQPFLDSFFLMKIERLNELAKNSADQQTTWKKQLEFFREHDVIELWKTTYDLERYPTAFAQIAKLEDPKINRTFLDLGFPRAVDPLSWNVTGPRHDSTFHASVEFLLFNPGDGLIAEAWADNPIAVQGIEGHWFASVASYIIRYAGNAEDSGRLLARRTAAEVAKDERRSDMVRGLAMETLAMLSSERDDDYSSVISSLDSPSVVLRSEALRALAETLDVVSNPKPELKKKIVEALRAASTDREDWVRRMCARALEKIEAQKH
jgi:hypothetical protein